MLARGEARICPQGYMIAKAKFLSHSQMNWRQSIERFLRDRATERQSLKRIVSFTWQLSLAILICVCVGRQSVSVREQLFHSHGIFRAICFSSFPTVYSLLLWALVRAERRGRMPTIHLGAFGEMSYWGYGWNNWLTWHCIQFCLPELSGTHISSFNWPHGGFSKKSHRALFRYKLYPRNTGLWLFSL